MKILLLGYRGMLGADLLLKLSADHEVHTTGSDELDISSGEACQNVISAVMPDLVINAAAYTDVDGCESKREKCFSVNAQGVKNIAIACRDRAIKIVHFSTDYIFDGAKDSPYVETDACRPLNSYGLSKLEGERFLEAFSDNFLIIRSSWLYGKNGRNFVTTILEKARSVGRLDVVTDQVGSPTYTEDLADAVVSLINGGHRGIVHVTNSGSCSWYDFTQKILRFAGITNLPAFPITSDKLTRPAARPSYSVLDCRKFALLSGNSMRPWEEALHDYMASAGLGKVPIYRRNNLDTLP
ncbi:MAG: dTDP-4-dehydrorhamnose reductase [Deltaproteobacteria bacterium]|nr:dTDP-4-dehydrorhamnose reductase [Deltaproteobacteria bacterium]